jgi:hypothetical protein
MSNDKILYNAKPIVEKYLVDGASIEIDYSDRYVSLIKDELHISCCDGELEKEIEKQESTISVLRFALSKLNERENSANERSQS